MKRYNVVVKKTYTNKAGEEKSMWPTVGSLVFFPANEDKPDGYKLELNMFPNVRFYVFEQQEKYQKAKSEKAEPTDAATEEAAQDEGSDLPF